MAGGKEATWAAQPASSCCLNPWSRVWNILFNSGEGWFQRMMELQNHSKLYMKKRHKLDLGDRIDELANKQTLAIPAGFVCTSVQRPRKAESFSSLSRISYSAWHQAWANSWRCGATKFGCIRPILPMDTAAFSWRLLGALGCRRIGMSLEMRGWTHCWNSGSSVQHMKTLVK